MKRVVDEIIVYRTCSGIKGLYPTKCSACIMPLLCFYWEHAMSWRQRVFEEN